LVLFIAFTVRYNALYYPVISSVAFFLFRERIFLKALGFVFGLLLIAVFMQFTSNRYYELTGQRQFSPFSGWQVANNAMYAYRFVADKDVKKVPSRFEQLDKMVRNYFDTTRNNPKHPEENETASTVYMWTPTAPLQKYMANKFKKDSTVSSIKRWATVAPLFEEYGKYLISQYPLTFAKHYLWPNTLKYCSPPVEFLETYNMGSDSVHIVAQHWFGYKSNKVRSYFKDFRIHILDVYPILTGSINMAFLCGVLGLIVLKGNRRPPLIFPAVSLAACFWIINFTFSVFAAPIALRFQLFPVIIFLSFSLLIIEYIWKIATAKA
ncbi:MAG TPA: hypothetical protein VGE79_03795, partial [Niastella sp.]